MPKSSNPVVGLLQRKSQKLTVRDNLLYRVTRDQNGRERCQLVLPEKCHFQVMKSLHDDAGHLGVERTVEFLRDVLANVLVITNYFTRYAQTFPTKDQKAVTVAKVLCEKFFVHYGLPARIHSDQGRDFESHLIKELLGIVGIRKSRMTPYHPQGDPQPKRFNRTLLSMLGTKKVKWRQHISQLVHAYNCSKNDATGYSLIISSSDGKHVYLWIFALARHLMEIRK